MITLKAPYPTIQMITYLPDAEYGDSESLVNEVRVDKMMEGTPYTHVLGKDARRKIVLPFQLTREKSLELRAFVFTYFRFSIVLIDHLERTWIVKLVSNPWQADTSLVALGDPCGEALQTVTLEFEGQLQ